MGDELEPQAIAPVEVRSDDHLYEDFIERFDVNERYDADGNIYNFTEQDDFSILQTGKLNANLQHMDFWFNPPKGGWQELDPTSTMDLPPLEQTTTEWANAYHPGEGKKSLEEVEEGEVVIGTITDMWLYHGVEVDIGAEFHGLIPIREEEWEDLEEVFWPEDEVLVRIHKVREGGVFRWPIQLEILLPDIKARIIHPDEWEPTVDHAFCTSRGMSFDDILKATGRTYVDTKYLPPENSMVVAKRQEYKMGFDEPKMDWPTLDPGEAALHMLEDADLDSAASQLMGGL